MKKKQLQSMQTQEMHNKLSELKRELLKANAQVATGTTPKSPGQIKQIKRTIARILTNLGRKKEV